MIVVEPPKSVREGGRIVYHLPWLQLLDLLLLFSNNRRHEPEGFRHARRMLGRWVTYREKVGRLYSTRPKKVNYGTKSDFFKPMDLHQSVR